MKHLIASCFLLGALYGHTQNTMSLEACIALAKEKNIDVERQVNTNFKLEHDENIAKGAFLPDLSFGGTQNFNLGNSFNVSTNVGQLESRSNTFYVASSLTIFDGLTNVHKKRLSKMNSAHGRLQLNTIRKNLELSITSAYLQALLHKEAIKIAENRLENSTKQLERITGLYKAASITKSELLENESLVESDKNGVVKAKNDFKNALISLKEILSVEDIEAFDVVDLDRDTFQANAQDESLSGLDDTRLETQHPLILMLASEAKLSQQQVKINRSKFYPKLSFDYSYGTGYYHLQGQDDVVFNTQTNALEANGFLKQLDANRLHYLGFSLVVPIFNRFVTKETYNKSKLNYQTATLNFKQGKKEILNAAQQAYNDMITARASLNSTHKILEFQEEAFNVSSEKYKLGISAIYEFIESRNRLFTAQTNSARAKYNYLLKLKIFKFYFE